MAVYRPTYKDPNTGELKNSAIWWYHFTFAGRRIQESSKSKRKTVALEAEKNRRRELEQGFNAIKDNRSERIKPIAEMAETFLDDYRLRNPKSITFATSALGHVKRVVGKVMAIDVSEETITGYQTARLKEAAAPKSINEEVTFLLRLLDLQGDILRAKLKKKKTLKLSTPKSIGRSFTTDEKAALLAQARLRRSPAIYPALMLALHVGMRDAEVRGLQWERVDLARAIVTVGDSKTEAGEGRTIPLNDDVLAALVAHSKWFLDKFGETRPEWYIFPFGKPQPTDPTRSATSFKTVWAKIRLDAGVTGRWHDSRHTFITNLAESGEASDETIRDIAGHVSKQMLKHYSHIGMEAKRRAVAAITLKPKTTAKSTETIEPAKVSAKVKDLN